MLNYHKYISVSTINRLWHYITVARFISYSHTPASNIPSSSKHQDYDDSDVDSGGDDQKNDCRHCHDYWKAYANFRVCSCSENTDGTDDGDDDDADDDDVDLDDDDDDDDDNDHDGDNDEEEEEEKDEEEEEKDEEEEEEVEENGLDDSRNPKPWLIVIAA